MLNFSQQISDFIEFSVQFVAFILNSIAQFIDCHFQVIKLIRNIIKTNILTILPFFKYTIHIQKRVNFDKKRFGENQSGKG